MNEVLSSCALVPGPISKRSGGPVSLLISGVSLWKPKTRMRGCKTLIFLTFFDCRAGPVLARVFQKNGEDYAQFISKVTDDRRIDGHCYRIFSVYLWRNLCRQRFGRYTNTDSLWILKDFHFSEFIQIPRQVPTDIMDGE